MLTDLNFLATGQSWPPKEEISRLETYRANRRLFEGEHATVYAKQFRRIEQVIGNFSQIISYGVVLNYHQLMSVKIADLVFGEPPAISIADSNKRGAEADERQKVIDDILLSTDLINKCYEAALDVSRYGDGLLIPYILIGAAAVDVTTPAIWFPIVSKRNLKRIEYHVLGYHYAIAKDKYELYVQIHKVDEPGTVEEHTYQLLGAVGSWRIGNEISETDTSDISVSETELSVCPVFRIPGLLTSDRIYGIDDYNIIDSILSELIIRLSQISKVLDVHANPSMSGPGSAAEQDPNTGEWHLKIGDYFIRNSADDAEPKYIVWDASMDANFKQIDTLLNQLYSLSEMGAAIFGDIKAGQVPSGSALRRLMMSPLAKAKRLANRFDPVLKQIIAVCAEINGTTIAPSEISISWNDGLPNDPVEEATIESVRTAGKATCSQWSAIKRLDRMTNEDVDSEMEQMETESTAATPIQLRSIDSNADDPIPPTTEE